MLLRHNCRIRVTSALVYASFWKAKSERFAQQAKESNLYFNANQITEFYTQIRVKRKLDVTNNVAAAKVTSALESSYFERQRARRLIKQAYGCDQ